MWFKLNEIPDMTPLVLMTNEPGMTTTILETERLRLRPRTMADLDDCLAMDFDPEVGRYLYPHGRPSREERRRVLQEQLSGTWPPVGGAWTVEWCDRPGFLGWCGLFPLQDSGLTEIGYRFIPTSWGRGVATEAAARVLAHGFQALEIDPIVAVTHPENKASQAVLTKIGLRYQGLRFHYGLDLSFFELGRADYLARRP